MDERDRILGAIFGHALGSAVGIQAKFRSKNDLKIAFPYSEKIKEYDINDWSADTDQLAVVMMSIVDKSGIDLPDLIDKLSTWSKKGLSDLNDNACYAKVILKTILSNEDIQTKPFEVANKFWELSNKKLASNISLSRASAAGLMNVSADISAELTKITCADPRCVCAGIILSSIINELVYFKPDTSPMVDNLLTKSITVSRSFLRSESMNKYENYDEIFTQYDSDLSNWVRKAYEGNIANLSLDEMSGMDFVFRTLSCAIYVLKVIKASIASNRSPSFKKIILKFAAECGDADVNCATAGSVLGSYIGYSKLPAEWVDALPHKEWLNKLSNDFIDKLPN